MVKLSIIIINYNSLGLIRNCLNSIYQYRPSFPFEIILVNNDETLQGSDPFRADFPDTRWIQMNYNAGFARANNEGIRQASGEIVLLLNPDTIMTAGALETCYLQFIADDYVACGSYLMNEDGSPQISGNFFVKGGLNYLLPLPYTGAFIKWLGVLFKVKKPHVDELKTRTEVDWINGAFLMVKQSAIRTAGLLDEDFFLYSEEAEWCARLRKTGKLCIYGNARVYHLQGVSANLTFSSSGKGYYNLFDRKGRQIMLSNLVRIRKQFGMGWFLLMMIFYTLTIPVFLAGTLISLLLPHSRRKYRFADYFGFIDNVFYVWSLSPRILQNKPYFYKAS